MTISPKCPSSDRSHRKEKLLRSPWTSYPKPSGTECIKLYHSQTSQKHIRKLLSKPRNNEIYNNLRKDLFLLGPLYYTFLHVFPHIHLSLKGWNMPSPNQGCWDKLCLPTTFPMVSASRKETPHTTRATSLEHMRFLIPRTRPPRKGIPPVQDRLCLHLVFGVLSGLSLFTEGSSLSSHKGSPSPA